MQKKALSHIDWVISLAIFLLFVAWFFIFISPSINFQSNNDNSLMMVLKKNFESENTWEMKKFPLFIDFPNKAAYTPIIIDYPRNNSLLEFSDKTRHILWLNKLIFLANISSNTSVFWLLEKENSLEYHFEGLNVETDRVSTENLSAYFEESLLSSVNYKGKGALSGLSYKLNEVSFSTENYSNTDLGFAAMYAAASQNINHTSIIFAHNPEIYNFITFETASDFVLTINLELNNYPGYFSDNNNFGDFGYENEIQYLNYAFDSITLYGDSALTMFFDSQVNFNFTYFNTTLMMQIDIPVSKTYSYKYIFHDGNFSSVSRIPYTSRFGVVETLRGININNITLNQTRLKTEWNFPKDFDIRLYENTSAYAYLYEPSVQIGTFNPKRKKVFAETKDTIALNADGTYSPLTLSYRIW